ncbi:hypothetical protein [Sulfuricurvum sp.]|uniref:hypothetical protein n=1 Tax=Sulfuricurvum sp. TaxID=2025608 RepID=UPI00273527A7|nr:hypothetical protein [Sulfuricurvum sp.]
MFNKEIYWTITQQVVLLATGLILLKLLSTLLSVKDYGYYSLVTSILALILVFPFGVFLQGVGRYISVYQNKKKYKEFYSTILIFFTLLILFISLFAFILKSVINITDTWNSIYSYIVFCAISEVLKGLFSAINNANRQRKNLAISAITESILKLVLIYSSYLYNQVTLTNVLIALTTGNLFAVIIMGYKNKNDLQLQYLNTKEAKIYLSRIWFFSYPLLIWAIFTWLRDMSNRWYLDYFLEKEQVAYFTMAGSISLIVPTAIYTIIGSFFVPILYQKVNFEKGYVKKFLIILLPSTFLFFILCFVIILILKSEIILVVANSNYLQVAWMLPWMFLIYSVYTISMMATYEIFAHKRTKILIVSSIIPGLLSLICGYFLIMYYGLAGALYNYALTYLSYSLLTFYVVYKYWRTNV